MMNITRNTYSFLESWGSSPLPKPEKRPVFSTLTSSRFCSWMIWPYRSRYPTSMACGESRSHLLGKLEVHALHYPPLVSIVSVWHMGFLSTSKSCHKSRPCNIVEQLNFDRPDCKRGARNSKSIENNTSWKSDRWRLSQWKVDSNSTPIDKDILGDSPRHDRTVLILYVPLNTKNYWK